MVTSSRTQLSQFVNHTTDLSGQLRNITDISPGPLENPSGYLMFDCRLLVLTSCLFYFPTTMVVMYCYGTIYSSQKLILKNRCRWFWCSCWFWFCMNTSDLAALGPWPHSLQSDSRNWFKCIESWRPWQPSMPSRVWSKLRTETGSVKMSKLWNSSF